MIFSNFLILTNQINWIGVSSKTFLRLIKIRLQMLSNLYKNTYNDFNTDVILNNKNLILNF